MLSWREQHIFSRQCIHVAFHCIHAAKSNFHISAVWIARVDP